MNKPALRFIATIKKLDTIFKDATSSSDIVKKELYYSFIIIKIHDQWNYRSRQIVIQDSGRKESEATNYLRLKWGRKKMDNYWEPDWHIPANAIRAARLLNVPNLSNIQNALGAVTCIDDIRWTRNAVVHNIPTSFEKYNNMLLRNYHIVKVPPYSLLNEINPLTGNTIYEDWSNELKIALCNAI